jgi:hypothetical protein
MNQSTTIRTRRLPERRGYALVLVFVFVVVFLGLLSVAWCHVASALRIERAVEIRRRCDEGSIRVLSLAMEILETRLRWDASYGTAGIDVGDGGSLRTSNFSCKTQFYPLNDTASTAGRWYTVTFTPDLSVTNGTKWNVTVAPNASEPLNVVLQLPSSPPSDPLSQ